VHKMEVNNRSQISNYMGQDFAASTIKIGDIGSMVIKERTGNNEAKVLLKGQELTVSFDGPMPSEDRSFVQITNQNENGQFTVKTLSNSKSSSASQSVDDLLKKSGFDPNTNPDLKEAANQILSRGGMVTKDTLTNIQDFLKNDIGTVADKLETINIMQQKNLEFTKTQLHAVHTALNGTSLTESLKELVSGSLDIPATNSETSNGINSEAIEKLIAFLDPVKDAQTIANIKKAWQIQKAGIERISQALSDSDLKEAIRNETDLNKIIQILKKQQLPQNVEAAINDALKLEKIGAAQLDATLKGITKSDRDYEPMQDAIKLLQKEPSLEKVLEGMKKLLESSDVLSGLKSALEKATQLYGQGRELAARKELSTAIQQLQENNPPSEDSSLTKAEQYYINEAVQSLKLDSKNVLVTQITKKLSQLVIDFKQMHQEIIRNLDASSRLIEANSPVPAKQMLEATISKLDQTILKGDFLLYTDMSTEKKLLTASSRLTEAKNLLIKGKITEANQLVKEVKNNVDGIIFKPSDSRVKHMISDQDLLSPKSMIEKAVSTNASARDIFETIKKLGLTHEIDSANALIKKEDAPSNLKSVLLQMHDGPSNPQAEKALATITGQQLLNKPDSSSVQNLFMQLPILLNKHVENVKVYVNSQKKGEKIDWENCNLTFLLETKKLGAVGITISAVNRNLSITLKNNLDDLQAKIQPLTEVTKEHLQEIGYQVGAIQFKPLSEKQTTVERSAPMRAAFTEKGYDFTI
jgi:hypothetical protein